MRKSCKKKEGQGDAKTTWFVRLGSYWDEMGKPFVKKLVFGIVIIVLLALLLNGLDQTFKAYIIQQNEGRVQSYLGRFFISPAMGGLAALVAALITASVIALQLHHTKEKDREDNWWQRYEWITERAFPSKKDDSNPVHKDFAIDLLTQLSVESKTDLQGKACKSFMTHLLPGGGPSLDDVDVAVPSPKNTPDEPKPTGYVTVRRQMFSPRMFKAALDYVDANEGKAGSSPEAEIYVFKHQISSALRAAGERFRPAATSSDMIVVGNGDRRVHIAVLPRDRQKAMERISSLRNLGEPVLALTPKALHAYRPDFYLAFWQPSDGPEELIKKIKAFEAWRAANSDVLRWKPMNPDLNE